MFLGNIILKLLVSVYDKRFYLWLTKFGKLGKQS